jgi:DNA-binding MarR family transcriptional regulator
LNGALKKRGLALLRLRGKDPKNWSVLGDLSKELADTLKVIGNEGSIPTGSLAEKMGLKIQACSNRVVELGRLHLIRRSRVEGERGVKHENALAIG